MLLPGDTQVSSQFKYGNKCAKEYDYITIVCKHILVNNS